MRLVSQPLQDLWKIADFRRQYSWSRVIWGDITCKYECYALIEIIGIHRKKVWILLHCLYQTPRKSAVLKSNFCCPLKWNLGSFPLLQPPPLPAILTELLSPRWCSAEQYGSSFYLIKLWELCTWLFTLTSFSKQSASWKVLEICEWCALSTDSQMYSVNTLVAVPTARTWGGGGGDEKDANLRFSLENYWIYSFQSKTIFFHQKLSNHELFQYFCSFFMDFSSSIFSVCQDFQSHVLLFYGQTRLCFDFV